MAKHKPAYLSYLLRIWQVDDDEARVWRASLQRPGGEERRGFADLEGLFAYLRSQACAAADPTPTTPDGDPDQGKEADEHSSEPT